MTAKFKPCIDLIGGGTSSLDAIDGAGLSDGDAAVVVLSTGVYHYHLNATSGASENSPYVIAPDTNAGTKRWVLVTPQAPMSHVEAERSTAQNIVNNVDTTVIYNTETYDLLSEYNNTTGIFTAKYAGLYSVYGAFLMASKIYSNASYNVKANIEIDGSVIRRGYRTHAPGISNSFLLSGIVKGTFQLTAGQTIEISAAQTSDADNNLHNAAEYNYLTIDRLV